MPSNKILIIKGPRLFYSHTDEDVFFYWLRSITAVSSVVGTSKGLEIRLKQLTEKTIDELLAVMTRYEIDTRALATVIDKKTFALLCNSEKKPRSKERYKNWQRAIFGRKNKRLYS